MQVEEADPRRLGAHAAISAAAYPACFLADFHTHNIAARSLGRGMPLVEARPGNLPTRNACLPGG